MADPTTTALMNTNLQEVFGQRDPALRREAMARTYTEDVGFTDESGTIVGHSAIDDRDSAGAASASACWHGRSIAASRRAPSIAHHSLCRHTWRN